MAQVVEDSGLLRRIVRPRARADDVELQLCIRHGAGLSLRRLRSLYGLPESWASFASSDSGDAQSSKRHAPTKRAKKDRLDSKACDFATPHDPPEPPEHKEPQTSSGQCQMRTASTLAAGCNQGCGSNLRVAFKTF